MPKTIFTGANWAVVDVLREVRLEGGITQVELARRVGRDQSHISLIEGSQRRLDLVEFYELAKALGVKPIDLFARIANRLDKLPN